MSLALLPRMLERDAGVIVNVSSFGGRAGILNEAAYCASKFALCGWSESMHLDLWDTGVRGAPRSCPAPSPPRSGTSPATTRRRSTGPFETAESLAPGIIAAIEGDRFEHYLPDMKPIAEMKTSDVDGFFENVIAFDPPPAT